MSLLKLEKINTGYGKRQVLYDVSLELDAGEVVLLIGSNGSGKSTLMKAIYRLLPLWKVKDTAFGVEFDGANILNKKPFDLIKKGLVYIPQQQELFVASSVADNLENSVLHLKARLTMKQRQKEVFSQFPKLATRRKQAASQLSGGERKILSLGMAIMNRPKLLLLDEPLAGVAMDKLQYIQQALKLLKAAGTTFLIVEHRVKELFEFADRVIGMRQGELASNPITSIDNARVFLMQ